MPPLLDKYLNDTLKNNPLAFYRMREGTGTTMLDFGPNGLNGTYAGSGVNWTTVAPQTSGGSANWGFAVSSGRDAPLWNSYITTFDPTQSPATVNPTISFFDGTAGRAAATLTGINTSAASSVTVELWTRWDGVLSGSTGTFEAIANFAGTSGPLLGFLKNGASDYRFGISVRNTGDLWGLNNADTVALFQRGTYHHIVFVLVNNAIQTSKLYIDGVQHTMTQQIGTTTTTKSVTTAFALGYDSSASFYGGSISETAVYNGEVYNAAAILNRYHQGAYGGEHLEIATLPGIETQVELYGNTAAPNIVLNDKNQPNTGNMTRTLDNYYLTEIDGMDDPDIIFNEDSNFYRDGTNPLISRYGGRTITFNGYIDAHNFQSLRRLQTRLKGEFMGSSSPFTIQTSGQQEFPMIFRNVWNNGFDFLINARKNSAFQMKEAQTEYAARRDFLLTTRASFPFFESAGSRTEVLQMGATLAIPTKGNYFSLPIINIWGPFTDARLVLGNTLILQASVLASSFISVDCKNRTCSNWAAFNSSSDFPFINAAVGNDVLQSVASFVSVLNGTLGVTRVEITWKHTVI